MLKSQEQLTGTEIVEIQEKCRRRAVDCGFGFDVVILLKLKDTSIDVTIEYSGNLTFEMLSLLSVRFGTRKIDVGCDNGTGSDRCHDKYVVVREATKL